MDPSKRTQEALLGELVPRLFVPGLVGGAQT